MFASSHLPGLLSLVRETTAVEGLRTDEAGAGTLVLRLYDSLEPASSPDRMSRLIDAIDMLYSACALLSEATASSIRLMSVSGVAVRSVIFHGDSQTINATQKVVAHLNQVAAASFENNTQRKRAVMLRRVRLCCWRVVLSSSITLLYLTQATFQLLLLPNWMLMAELSTPLIPGSAV